MTTELQELKFIDYAKTFNQKLTFALLKIGDCKEISEEEELLLKEVFRIQWFGNYPLFVTKLALEQQTVSQTGLFDCNSVSTTDETANGMTVAYTPTEPTI
jgi:hypothetical protein